MVRAHVDGYASDDEVARLQAAPEDWVEVLVDLRNRARTALDHVSETVHGPERELVLEDFQSDHDRIDAVLRELVHVEEPETPDEPAPERGRDARSAAPEPPAPWAPALQLSWLPGRVVAWVGGPGVRPQDPPGGPTPDDDDADTARPDGGGELADADRQDDLARRLAAAGADTVAWEPYPPITLPDGTQADAVSVPLDAVLGWLVARGSVRPASTRNTVPSANDEPDAPLDAALDDLVEGDVELLPDEAPAGGAAASESEPEADLAATGRSATWLGRAIVEAVGLVAQGRMVPQLRRRPGRDDGATPRGRGAKGKEPASARSGRAPFEVHWSPALLDAGALTALAGSMPGAVAVLDGRRDARAVTEAVIGDAVHTLCVKAAERVEVPAPPPQLRTNADVAETVLARLDGSVFEAPLRAAGELSRRLEQWAGPVKGSTHVPLVIQLDPPDDGGAWYLSVLAAGDGGRLGPVEGMLVTASPQRRADVRAQLTRLERLFPELLRPGGRRRGEVILSQDEAWRLMTVTGDLLVASGFDVRIPALSRRRPTPTLRLTSEDAQSTVVGARQLANVRWSAVFDDVELSAEEITQLARQARPLVQSRGRWVELDRADLAAAAAALAERADKTRLSGADMLRHVLGLEGSPLAGGIALAGEGWAADLLRSAADLKTDLVVRPEGFVGELRRYQAEAVAWLRFLEGAGLGGCLALDMGLGKTPVMLAHLRERARWAETAGTAETATDPDAGPGAGSTSGAGPALVIAPPAVVGNWAAEARRFVPGLRVVVHHGPERAGVRQVPALVARADLVITTYGTALRDLSALEKIEWAHVILDEAQVIKNPASETAQQLRRLQARTRVALTGTPIENGLGDLWAIMDFVNPGLVGGRPAFVAGLSRDGEGRDGVEKALRALNGILVFRRTKLEPLIAAELPDRIDELDHCAMTPEQIGLYQAVLDTLVSETLGASGGAEAAAARESGRDGDEQRRKGAILAAITALKQICNHPAAYRNGDHGGAGSEHGSPAGLAGRSGKLARLDEIVDNVFDAGERVLIFTHFATWGEKLATYLTERTGVRIACYHGGLSRGARDRLVHDFQAGTGAGALVLSLKAGGTGLNLTAANHVVLYDRWWNPAVEDQARDRAWRIGQRNTVICHRLVCPGTVDERVEEVVAGKRRIADMVLPKASTIADLDGRQLRAALGIDRSAVLLDDRDDAVPGAPRVGAAR